MKKFTLIALVMTLLLSTLAGCGVAASNQENTTIAGQAETTVAPTTVAASTTKGDEIIIAWYPNESGEELSEAREQIGAIIEKATGMKVKHQTTTDYLIAIEALAAGTAHIAFTGGEGYVQAHDKNPSVLPLVTNSGASGTLDDAKYYSWLNVAKGSETQYMKDGKYSIDNIVGKKFSFVSNSSTSGFKVPSADILSHFNQMDAYKNLTREDLIESGTFFSEVLFGGSHQGSAVNLLNGSADIAAFCDTCVSNYVELVSGELNTVGSVVKVKDDAAEPFNTVLGKEFVVISVTPVLNGPIIANTEVLSAEHFKAIQEALTSDETTNNPKIFVAKDSEFKGLWKAGERFLAVEDAWYNPIRELGK